ncbi:hypothetical protein [Archangium primigenium]|uniref:hypothetical protein n=1 Tax=[Archangium] primigenium TaxID=2792470 RepID=UPI001957A7BF|nr:hypothetical protein [Archangium primigenium]MBM7116747.1 hypothetical protein [Archangium primigenium]
MKRITDRIESNKRRLDQSALMMFVQDASVEPRRRFSFVPCMAPFVMGFSDVNKYALRDEGSQDPIQHLINVHSQEDDHHWGMYLKDLRTLGLNAQLDLNGALRLLWGDDRQKTRQTIYSLMGLIENTTPAVRMAVVEAIEATGDVAFTRFSALATEFEKSTGETLAYFGALHKDLESGHAMGTEDIEAKVSAIEMSPEMEREALGLVDQVFELFHRMFEEWMAYAQRQQPGAQSAVMPTVRMRTVNKSSAA